MKKEITTEIKDQLAQDVEQDWSAMWNELRSQYPQYEGYDENGEWDGVPVYCDKSIDMITFDKFKEMLIDQYKVSPKLFDHAEEYYDFDDANWKGYIEKGAIQTPEQIKNLLIETKFEALS